MIDMRDVTHIYIEGPSIINSDDYEELDYLRQDPDDTYVENNQTHWYDCMVYISDVFIKNTDTIELVASNFLYGSGEVVNSVRYPIFQWYYSSQDIYWWTSVYFGPDSSTSAAFLAGHYASSQLNDKKQVLSNSINSTDKFKFTLKDGYCSVENLSTGVVQEQTSSNIVLSGSQGYTGSLKLFFSSSRSSIYSVRIYNEFGVLTYEFLPAKRKSDDVLGMFDNVSGQFYEGVYDRAVTPKPAGGFIAGPSKEGKEVVKIETYINNNLVQIWPCYSPGPSNPDAPVVSNAFDYDDTITWTVGTGVENTDEYYYYPITATGQANGIQIAVADNPNGWNSDGKPTSGTTYTWYVQAERAGYYQMIMSAKMSSAGHATTGYWSGADIQVNGSTSGVQKLTLYGDTPDFDAVDYNDIVVAIVPLTGNEDAVSFRQSSWRIVVDPTSNIIFREVAATSPAYITLDTSNVQTSFTQGDTFNYSGLGVTQTLVNGTTSTISSGYTVSSPDMSTSGDKTVTVTYGSLTASYTITVASAGAAWVTTATLTNSDNKTVEQGTCGGYDAVRIGVLDYSSGGFGSDGRVSGTSTDEVYKITPPSAGDYMLILPIRKGSGDPQFYVNGQPIGAVSGTNTSTYEYIEITYPVTLTSGENTLTIRNNSYRCYWDTDNYVYLVKSATNPF